MARNSSGNRTVSPVDGSRSVRIVFIVGLALVLLSGYLFWRQVVNSPQNVFNGMLDNSFKTRSFGKQTNQNNAGQLLDQRVLLQSGSQKIARSLTTLSQSAGSDKSTVNTESIGTPHTDYFRYTGIETNQTGSTGGPLDFSNVLNIWGQSQPGEPASTSGQLYGESTLGVIPLGYLKYQDRKDLTKLIKDRNVFAVDYANVKKETVNGRPIYVYNVEVEPENYVTMLMQFAKAVGLTQLEDLDTSNFRGSPKLKFELTVDIWSRQLTKVNFLDSGLEENYKGYGSWVPTALPEQSISVEELQSRLQTVQ